ncbi:MAG TPA: hypothetical protein VGI12_12920 [Vicinamibacterales bacterium]
MSGGILKTAALCGVCLLLAARPAAAEWHFTPSFGVTFAGSTTLNDLQLGTGKRHFNFGGMVSHFGDGVIGVEGIVLYTRHFFEFDGPRDPLNPPPAAIATSYSLSATGNLVLTVPKRWTEYFLRPYVSGGFGLLRAVSIDQPSSTQESQHLYPVTANMPGFSIGAGAIGFFSQGTGIRFDVRYHGGLRRDPGSNPLNGTSSDLRLHYMTAEIGLVIRR